MAEHTTSCRLKSHGLTQSDVAAALGITASAVNRKLSGGRPWRLDEMQRLVSWLKSDKGITTTLDELFGSEVAA